MQVKLGESGEVATIDDSDATLIAPYRWFLLRINGHKYAVRHEKRRAILMHRILAGAVDGQLVDHRDRNGLNNSRSNLRVCNHAENMRNKRAAKNNRSGFKGVYQRKNRWTAEIKVNGQKVRLGSYLSPEAAHAAYTAAAHRLHGEFARAV